MTLTQYDFDIGEGEGQFRHFTQVCINIVLLFLGKIRLLAQAGVPIKVACY